MLKENLSASDSNRDTVVTAKICATLMALSLPAAMKAKRLALVSGRQSMQQRAQR
ncbi:hypothetical protein ACFL2V_14860 [Pseudomonadota bacterium]